MVPEKMLSIFGLKDKKDVSMANNIWKMLDEMAQSNPDTYRQFVQKNVQTGFTELKDKQ